MQKMQEYSFTVSVLKLDLKQCSLTPPWQERNRCQPAAEKQGNKQEWNTESQRLPAPISHKVML